MVGSAPLPRDAAAPTLAFLTALLERSANLDREAPELARLRASGRNRLTQAGLPTGKLETFKYTPIARFYRNELLAPAAQHTHTEGHTAGMQLTLGGRAVAPGSPTLPDGLRIVRLSTGAAEVLEHLDVHVDRERHPLAALNTGLVTDGVLIHLSRGVRLKDALRVEYPRRGDAAALTRLLVVLDADAELTLVEADRETGVVNRVSELVLGNGSRIAHARIQHPANAPAWSLCAVDAGAGSFYRHRLYAAGGQPRRNDLHVRLTGDGADVDLKGAFGATNNSVLDNQVVVEHIGLRGVSRHRFHGVAAERSELTFNGRIHIHAGAAKTDAELRTMNLLLDDTARINSKPELEIYNDDVKCAHGATIGKLDDEAMFYLRSRGLDVSAARRLLLQAFIARCIDEPSVEEEARGLFEGFWT